MLTEEQMTEIREHLENAKNPVFFFDNDPDGLCSFLILQRFLGKGRGVVIKSYPYLDKNYFSRVEEFKADYIFVLDKGVDDGFIEQAKEKNIPVVCIDHHNMPKPEMEYYYNPFYNDKTNEPVSYLCYRITRRKEDIWLAALGCISDSYVPDFFKEFTEKYGDLVDSKWKNAFDIRYKTRLGKILALIGFAMKDRTSNVVAMMKFLIKVSNPGELLEENEKTRAFFKRFNEINEKYQRLMKKAEEDTGGDILFFSYSGDISISQYVADELMYKYPGKVIVVIYSKGNIANISLRWDRDIRTPLVEVIKNIEGSRGGGHENSSGARIPSDKIPEFKENLSKEIEKIRKKE